MSEAAIIPLFGPSDSDWITTIRTRDGRVLNRRICPGRMDEADAVRVSIHASELAPSDIIDVSARRAGDATVIADRVEDEFKQLMASLESAIGRVK